MVHKVNFLVNPFFVFSQSHCILGHRQWFQTFDHWQFDLRAVFKWELDSLKLTNWPMIPYEVTALPNLQNLHCLQLLNFVLVFIYSGIRPERAYQVWWCHVTWKGDTWSKDVPNPLKLFGGISCNGVSLFTGLNYWTDLFATKNH